MRLAVLAKDGHRDELRTSRDHGHAILLLILLACNGVWAHAAASCDPSGRTFTFIPSDYADGESSPREPQIEERCRWNDGTLILVHYITAGGDQAEIDSTVSIWVNEAKWVDSALTFEFQNWEHSYQKTTRITIDAKGLTTCQLPVHNPSGLDGDDQPTGPEVCTMRRTASLPHRRDGREFPESSREVPEPPAARVVQGTDPKLCEVILKEIEGKPWTGSPMFRNDLGGARLQQLVPVDPGDISATDLPADDAEGPGSQGLNPPKWDINNTGHPLWVLHTEEFLSARLIQTYFAYDDAGLKQLKASDRTKDDLYRYATRVYPDSLGYCQLAKNANGANRPTDCEISELLDLDINPVAIRGTNYLFLSKGDHFVSVIKPLGSHDYEMSCLLEKVQLGK